MSPEEIEQLPGAVLEQTVHPDYIAVGPQPDGSLHLLLYSGQTENGYIDLKYVLLDPEHVREIVTALSAVAHAQRPEHPAQIGTPDNVEVVVPFREDIVRRAAGLATIPEAPRLTDDELMTRYGVG